GGFAHDGEGRAFTRAELCERIDTIRRNREDVALLRFVAPDFERRHAGLVVGQFAQVEFAAAAAVVDEFGQGVGNAAGADVVNERDGILIAERPAAIDDFLATTLHLGVVALHGSEIEIFAAGSAGDRAGRAAAETDVHA